MSFSHPICTPAFHRFFVKVSRKNSRAHGAIAKPGSSDGGLGMAIGMRLVRREKARWGGSPEHDKIDIHGPTTGLAGDLCHDSFPSMNRYIEKINIYSDVFLQRQNQLGKRWSLMQNVARPLWRFFRAYVFRWGFLDGYPGLWIAVATAFSTFVRYSRQYEEESRQKNASCDSPLISRPDRPEIS